MAKQHSNDMTAGEWHSIRREAVNMILKRYATLAEKAFTDRDDFSLFGAECYHEALVKYIRLHS